MSDEVERDSTFERPGATDTGEDGARPSAALVQIDDGLAVLYGDHLPEGPEFIPLTLIDEPTRDSISTAIASAAGFGNLAGQGASALMQAQGLVRLAPQTLEGLKTAAPLVKDGWNLGTLASEGKFVAQVRWLPAGGASAASVIASMGPALTLMAIQFQLNQIADLAQHNLELTSKVLQVVRQEQWSQVTGYHSTILKELSNAREIGVVTDAIYKEIRGYQGPLSTQWDLFERAVRAHVKELRSKQGHKERQEYLTDHGEAIIADVQSLLLAQTSWFLYQALRAGHLLHRGGSNPQDAALLKKSSLTLSSSTTRRLTRPIGCLSNWHGSLLSSASCRANGPSRSAAAPERPRSRRGWCGSCRRHWQQSETSLRRPNRNPLPCPPLGYLSEPFRGR